MVHLLSLPNVQNTRAYDLDGFNTATLRFSKVLDRLGMPYTLYGSEEHETNAVELVTCITKAEQASLNPQGLPYQHAHIGHDNPMWQLSNPRMAQAIHERKQPRDLICSIGGGSQKLVSDENPDLMTVEYNIGYVGNFSRYRVFQSRAWQHLIYGLQGSHNEPHCFDAVIPAFFEPERFPENTPEEYIVYVGRLTPLKGIQLVQQACKAAGVPLKVIGHGDPSLITYGEYLGPLPEDERNEVVSKARALMCPTLYVEPFGCISPEAQLCGAPVISTDFGGFTETVEQGRTGFRCGMLGEFVQAIERVTTLDREYIRARAQGLYGIEAAVTAYREYFRKLDTLWDDGFNTLPWEGSLCAN